jgi:hypothetical protein
MLRSLNKKVGKFIKKDKIGNMKRTTVIKGIELFETDELENKTRINDEISLFKDLT